ncbi:helix-turn-helix domain-containing protein [Streptomyces sp. YC504]|uniref:Helix-turn-helix domain-containing protein n=1 Tax=Streptomyces mesophilus TaxID=1775132 RepID=A0A6G4XFG6_9ACTN|nr:helix-turn-helix domain-containing protein [Streptomyces mesophilus]NGO75973.1 helix-turn-helix domain-containing protein [Streptomyces mesophilus]
MKAEEAALELIHDSRGIPLPEQADWWRAATLASPLPTRVHPERAESFSVRVAALTLGDTLMNAVSRGSESASRTAALIRRSDPETFQLELVTSGRKFLAQAQRSSEVTPGQLVLYDSSQPLESRSAPPGSGSGPTTSLIVHVPRRLLPVPARHAATLIAAPIQATQGPGLLLAQFLRGLAAGGGGSTSGYGRARLGTVMIDLMGAVLAHRLERDALQGDAGERVLSLRIHSYIRHHLTHPELTPASIAAAHQISVRSLQRLFRAEGTTTTELVRLLRLGRAAQALTDPRQITVPVHAVGARWGFPRAADFSRAFRSVYGMPPGEYRLRAQAGAPSQEPVAER